MPDARAAAIHARYPSPATDVVDSQLRNTHICFLHLLLGCFAGIIDICNSESVTVHHFLILRNPDTHTDIDEDAGSDADEDADAEGDLQMPIQIQIQAQIQIQMQMYT